MTGRDLILYILLNKLEDEFIFKDGKSAFFITDVEAAERYDMGVATIRAWVQMGRLPGVWLGDKLYILKDAEVSK